MSEPNQETANILIVDDVTANLILLVDMIKQTGYEARPVTSVKQAMKAIEKRKPDLILLDVSMPEIDGFEYCSMLKKDVKTRDIPVMFISAMTRREDKLRGFHLGAVDFIQKPFEVEEVAIRINTHLQIGKLRAEQEAFNRRLQQMVEEQQESIANEQKNIIEALLGVSQARGVMQKQFAERISRNSRMLAIALQLSPKYERLISRNFVDAIEIVAPLFNIGEALQNVKSGFFEYSKQKNRQTVINQGAVFLKESYMRNRKNEYLKMAVDVVLCFYEEWDGNGFPEGRKGEAIPLSTRIVRVAVAYAMTEEKKEMTPDKRILSLKEAAGKQLDPEIVGIADLIKRQLR